MSRAARANSVTGATSWQADFAATLFDPALPCPPDWYAANGSHAARRLAVHRNNVVSSLVDALADSFPVTLQLTGAEFFRAMAAVFVRAHPPRTAILAHYGADFAPFIADFAPVATLPYLADLARLEFARVTACHAADAAPLDPTTLTRALGVPAALAELRFAWHPSLQVCGSPYAVVTLWAAHQHSEDVERVERVERVELDHAEHAIVLRDALEVIVLPVAPGAACFTRLTQAGAVFGDAVAAAIAEQASFDPGALLSRLVHHGALIALHLPACCETIAEISS